MELHFEDRGSWRAWLEANHRQTDAVWLVFFKKHTGRVGISYDAAVEEALCFGWIDSLIRRLDEDRYARKFTPRTDPTKWSAANLGRVAKLEAAGRMTAAGRARLEPGVSPVVPPSRRPLDVPAYFQQALDANPEAWLFFEELAPSHRRNFLSWVDAAKREATRQRRLAEAMHLLGTRQKLGMK